MHCTFCSLSVCRTVIHNFDWTFTSEYSGTVSQLKAHDDAGANALAPVQQGSVWDLVTDVCGKIERDVPLAATPFVAPAVAPAGFGGGYSARAHVGGRGLSQDGTAQRKADIGRVSIGRAPDAGYLSASARSRTTSGGAMRPPGARGEVPPRASEEATAYVRMARSGAVFAGQKVGAGTGVDMASAAVGVETMKDKQEEYAKDKSVDVGQLPPLPHYLDKGTGVAFSAALPDLPSASVASTPRTTAAYADVTPDNAAAKLAGEVLADDDTLRAGTSTRDGRVVRCGKPRMSRIMSGLLWGGAMGALFTPAGLHPVPSLGLCASSMAPVKDGDMADLHKLAAQRWLPVGPMLVKDAAMDAYAEAMAGVGVADRFVDERVTVSKGGELVSKEVLQRRDPFVFFSHVPLFQDELGDNGDVEVSVKLRIMPTFFFILLRCFVRVDNVLVRCIDHRFSHQFGSKRVVREMTVKQVTGAAHDALQAEAKGLNDHQLTELMPIIATETVEIQLE